MLQQLEPRVAILAMQERTLRVSRLHRVAMIVSQAPWPIPKRVPHVLNVPPAHMQQTSKLLNVFPLRRVTLLQIRALLCICLANQEPTQTFQDRKCALSFLSPTLSFSFCRYSFPLQLPN